MMKKAMVALFLVLAFGSAQAADAWVVCKPGSCVNARMKPNTKSEVVMRFEAGDKIELDNQRERDRQGRIWLHIVNSGGEMDELWICGNYVSSTEIQIDSYDAIVDAKGRVAVRAFPDSKAERTRWVQPGFMVNVLAYNDGWAFIGNGYIRLEYLRRCV